MSNSSDSSSQPSETPIQVFDVSDRTQIEITGEDRARFLHSFTTNDIKSLRPGAGCETFVTNLKGKVVAHVYVFCKENSLWLDGIAGQEAAILNHLKKYVLVDDVQLNSRAAERGELYLSGAGASALLDVTLGMSSSSPLKIDGIEADLRRVDLLGELGCLISMSRSDLDAVRQALMAKGAVVGSPEQFESLRIKAGYPRYGVDITEENLAQEVARTETCVSFTKGCYLGQETIARIDSMGHTNQELRRLRFVTDVVPTAGAAILDVDGTNEIGTVTSAAIDSTRVVNAIGLLKRVALRLGTPVQLNIGEQRIAGEVV